MKDDAPVEHEKNDDAPVESENVYDLAMLLSQITDENLHPEISTGPPMGKEIW